MVFIVGVEEKVGQRIFNLLDTSATTQKNYKINEQDLIYRVVSDSNFKIENAVYDREKGKIIGKTGSLDKIKNKKSYVVIGFLMLENVEGYRISDNNGMIRDLKINEAIKFLKDKLIQNATIVDDKYLRGINWKIPMIDDKGLKVNVSKKVKLLKGNEVERTPPVNLVLSANAVIFNVLKDIPLDIQKWVLTDELYSNQLLLNVKNVSYILYAHESLIEKGYLVRLKEVYGNRVRITGKLDDLLEITLSNMINGFKKDLQDINKITASFGTTMEVHFQKADSKAVYQKEYLKNINYIYNETTIFDYCPDLANSVNMLLFLIDKLFISMSPYLEHLCSVEKIKYYNSYRTSLYKKYGDTMSCSIDYTSNDKYGFSLIEIDGWIE